MIETDRVSEIISKYKITPTQLYILWLLHTKDAVNIKKYIEVFGEFKREEFEDLEKKGLLLHTNRGAEAYRTTDLVVTLELTECLVKIEPEEAYEELFQLYPAFLRVNGKDVAAKALTFPDERSAKEAYTKIISKNKFIHQKILAAVNKLKEDNNGLANVKIDKYITGRLWEETEGKDNGTVKSSYY